MNKEQLAHTIAQLIRRGDKRTAGKLLAEIGKNRQRLPTRPPAPIAAGKLSPLSECDTFVRKLTTHMPQSTPTPPGL